LKILATEQRAVQSLKIGAISSGLPDLFHMSTPYIPWGETLQTLHLPEHVEHLHDLTGFKIFLSHAKKLRHLRISAVLVSNRSGIHRPGEGEWITDWFKNLYIDSQESASEDMSEIQSRDPANHESREPLVDSLPGQMRDAISSDLLPNLRTTKVLVKIDLPKLQSLRLSYVDLGDCESAYSRLIQSGHLRSMRLVECMCSHDILELLIKTFQNSKLQCLRTFEYAQTLEYDQVQGSEFFHREIAEVLRVARDLEEIQIHLPDLYTEANHIDLLVEACTSHHASLKRLALGQPDDAAAVVAHHRYGRLNKIVTRCLRLEELVVPMPRFLDGLDDEIAIVCENWYDYLQFLVCKHSPVHAGTISGLTNMRCVKTGKSHAAATSKGTSNRDGIPFRG